jgi:hypothetical protein
LFFNEVGMYRRCRFRFVAVLACLANAELADSLQWISASIEGIAISSRAISGLDVVNDRISGGGHTQQTGREP